MKFPPENYFCGNFLTTRVLLRNVLFIFVFLFECKIVYIKLLLVYKYCTNALAQTLAIQMIIMSISQSSQKFSVVKTTQSSWEIWCISKY